MSSNSGNNHVAARAAAAAASASAAATASGQQQQQQQQKHQVVTDLAPMIQKVKELNNGLEAAASLVPLIVDGATLGRMRPEFAAKLLAAGKGVFVESAATAATNAVTLAEGLRSRDARTAAVAPVLERLRDDGTIRGWRGELYPLARAFDAEPALLVERAAAPYFGMRSYGVHVNGAFFLCGGVVGGRGWRGVV
jgi:hypothetical protein